jgi:DNA-binding transcriptional regulator YdaS (Cro superfamily)
MEKKITPTRRRELAAQFGLSEQYLYQCLAGIASMDAAKAMQLELSTNGELRRVDLCQGRAHLIWPELARRQARLAKQEAKP